MALDELEYGEVVSVINGNLAHAHRLYREGKINWIERDMLIAVSGFARRDRGAEEKLYELFKEYLDEKGFEQLKGFVENQSRVSWLIFAKSYRIHKEVPPPIENRTLNLEEHRKKSVIVRDSFVEIIDKKTS